MSANAGIVLREAWYGQDATEVTDVLYGPLVLGEGDIVRHFMHLR